MFYFLNKILGTLICGILYPLLITAPLQILNGIYQAFQICCGASIGAMFFNQAQGHLIIDVNAPIFVFIIRTLIICVILIAVMVIVLAVEHVVTKKKVNLLSKIKWPLIAITSTVTIPLSFMLMSSLSVAFMSLIGGTSVQIYLLTANVSDMVTTMTRAITQLGENFNITFKDIEGKEFAIAIKQAIEQLRQAVATISQEAAKSGLQDLVDKCRLTMEYLGKMSDTLTNWNDTIYQPFNAVMEYISNPANWQGTNVKFNAEITAKLNSVTNSLNNFQIYWSNAISSIAEILKDAKIYCKESLAKQIEFGEHKMTIEAFLSTVSPKWQSTITPWAKFNNLWIDRDKDSLSLWTSMLWGGTWNSFDKSMSLVFDIKDHQTSLNILTSCIDPQTNNTYNLVVQIYQLVTGNKDTNWTATWNMSKGLSLINVGVGFIIIVGACFVTGLFGLMAARRLIELAILAISSIVFAVIGIRDDGAKFTNCVKLIVTKMFSIVIAFAAFTIGTALLETVSNWVTTHVGTIGTESFAFGVIQAFVLIGGLLGAYHIAILLQQWMGDSTSIQGTMADMGALGAMGGSAKIAGVTLGAAKLIGGGAKGIASHSKEKKSSKLWQMAEKKGYGQVQYSVGKHGKLQASGFKLNKEMDATGAKFNALMKNKDEYKKFNLTQKLDKLRSNDASANRINKVQDKLKSIESKISKKGAN